MNFHNLARHNIHVGVSVEILAQSKLKCIAPAMRKRCAALLCTGFLCAPLVAPKAAHAWGSLGHEVLAEVAAEQTFQGQAFWVRNASELGKLANVPDRQWKKEPYVAEEKPTHWFQIDHYISNPRTLPGLFRVFEDVVTRYTRKEVIENGTALWRAEQLNNLAIDAFAQRDYQQGLQIAGVLAHYVGDLSQPLHVTTNYNGQLSNNDGIHKFFETTNVQTQKKQFIKDRVTERTEALLASAEFASSHSDEIWDDVAREVVRSYENLDAVLEADTRYGRNGTGSSRQLDLAIERLASGAATLTRVLERIWDKARVSDFSQHVAATVPAWIPPNYSRSPEAPRPIERRSPFVTPAERDDCF